MSVLRAVYAFIRRIGSIGSMLRDPSVRFWKKLLVVGGIVYLFLPVDLIPPFLLPVGWIDDLALWIFITWLLRDTLDRYWKNKGAASDRVRKRYPDAFDVTYEVKEDSADQRPDTEKKKEKKDEY
ncbi:MAG: DUF1232 domain-containing protein [Eubacteriales bacterium]|jgi:uncharacterized membrane protein YkvA (DUF1232 family)|nr:DUF1232 domain-containing protein [Eubacteriales bacterium]